jgi:hypothetical protein
MTATSTTPLQGKLGPTGADAAGTITVQEASDVLDCSRFRVCEVLNANAGRVLVTDVLALKSSTQSSTPEAAPAAKLVSSRSVPMPPERRAVAASHGTEASTR